MQKYFIACEARDKKTGEIHELVLAAYDRFYPVLVPIEKCCDYITPNNIISLVVIDKEYLELAYKELKEQANFYKDSKEYSYKFFLKKANSANNKYKLSSSVYVLGHRSCTRTELPTKLYKIEPCKK